MAEIRHLENRHDAFFSVEGGQIWIKFRRLVQMTCRLRWCVEMETICRIPIWRTFGHIHWHVIPEPRRVLPLGEFTVTIPEPHATLESAVTWRNQCRDRATLQGVRIPSGILKIVFSHIFWFLMQFRLWRAAAFVSSPIHLFMVGLHRIFDATQPIAGNYRNEHGVSK